MLLAVYSKTFFSADIAAFRENTFCDFTEKIKDVNEEKAYTDFIRINISPTNPFIPLDDALRILDQPFEHFRNAGGSSLPKTY